MKLSLVIPCYNEEKNVEPFIKCCINTFGNDKYIEYIFINDGSKDNTFLEIKNIIEKYDSLNIVGINFSRNFGKEAAMLAGLKKSTGEYTALIDADLQQHPKYVKQMLEYIEEHNEYDCITCYQEKRKENKFIIWLKEKFYSLINKISDIPFYKNASDFRLFNRKVLSSVLDMTEYYRFSKGIFSYVGFNTYYMPYEVNERKYGKSSWSLFGLFKYALNGIIGFSVAPLKLATILGLITMILSVIYLIIVIIKKLFIGIAISGYPTIICLILIFGGLQMFLLGVIGEYLGRIYVELKRRPIYIVRDEVTKVNKSEKDENNKK